MPANAQNVGKHPYGLLWLMSALISLAVAVAIWVVIAERPEAAVPKPLTANATHSSEPLFSKYYPRNPEFMKELQLMRMQGRLKPQNEILINRTVLATSDELGIPPGVLWCLVFQESRLNHLLGLYDNHHARGLGQFSYFSFYEINHQLDKYTASNRVLFKNVLGQDIRPISAPRRNISQPSSYYYIPTAVTATAAYLNNRYHQLRRNLERKRISYDPDLLWLFAAMAYNKGTRSVLSFWNDSWNRGGNDLVSSLVTDRDSFAAAIGDTRHLAHVLGKIWRRNTADRYAKELAIHMEQLEACSTSLKPPAEVSRNRS